MLLDSLFCTFISRRKLLDAGEKHSGIDAVLDAWYRIPRTAKWKSLEEARRTYAHADGVRVGKKVYTVFNVAGNNLRLVTEICYEDQVLLVWHVLTHSEYDRGDWKR